MLGKLLILQYLLAICHCQGSSSWNMPSWPTPPGNTPWWPSPPGNNPSWPNPGNIPSWPWPTWPNPGNTPSWPNPGSDPTWPSLPIPTWPNPGSNPPCDGVAELPDREKKVIPKVIIYAIPDWGRGAVTDEERDAEIRFFAQVAYELDMPNTGSRIGYFDSYNAQYSIPADTDNADYISSRFLAQPRQPGNDGDITNVGIEKLVALREREEQYDSGRGVGLGKQVVVFAEGRKLNQSLARNAILAANQVLKANHEDVHEIWISSKYPKEDFVNFTLNEVDYDYIRLDKTTQGTKITYNARKFVQDLVTKSQGRLYYPRCNWTKFPEQNPDVESRHLSTISLAPNTVQYYALSPDTFFNSEQLNLKFTAEVGQVRICVSQFQRFPLKENEGRGTTCKETRMTNPETIDFSFAQLCSGKQKKDCKPINVSITPIGEANSNGGPQCLSTRSTTVTFGHSGMRC